MSKSSSRNATSQDVRTTNLNLQDIEGVTLVGTGNRVEFVDPGLVDLAGEVIEGSFEVIGDVVDESLDFGTEALASNEAVIEEALDFGDTALRVNERIVGESFDFSRDIFDGAQDTIGGVVADAFSITRDVTESAIGEISRANQFAVEEIADQVDRTVVGIQEFAAEQNQSADSRLAEFGQAAILAVAAIVLIPIVFRTA